MNSDPTPEQIESALWRLESRIRTIKQYKRITDEDGKKRHTLDLHTIDVLNDYRLALQLARERAEQIEEGPVAWLCEGGPYNSREIHEKEKNVAFLAGDPSWTIRSLYAGPPEGEQLEEGAAQ